MPTDRRSTRRGFAFLPLLLLLAVLAFVWWQRAVWLGWIGTALVSTQPPRKCDAILVMAGGAQGERILKGADLMRQGYAPICLVSDAMPFYEQSECRLAVDMAVRHGAQREWFECVAPRVRSTTEEAAAAVKVLRQRGAKRYMIVTTEFHSRRALGVFRDAAPELDASAVAADSVDFRIDRWWQHREGRKTILLEWTKSIAGLFGA